MRENSWRAFFKYAGIVIIILFFLVMLTNFVPESMRHPVSIVAAIYLLLAPVAIVVLLIMKLAGKGLFNGPKRNSGKPRRNARASREHEAVDKSDKREKKRLASQRVSAAKKDLAAAKAKVSQEVQQYEKKVDSANQALEQANRTAEGVIRYYSQPIATYLGVELHGEYLAYKGETLDLGSDLKCHIETSGTLEHETVYDHRARTTATRVITGAVIGGIPGAVIGGAARKKDVDHHSEVYDSRNVYLYIEKDGKQWLIIDSQNDDSDARIFMNCIINAKENVPQYKRERAANIIASQEAVQEATRHVDAAKADRRGCDAALAIRGRAEKELADARAAYDYYKSL